MKVILVNGSPKKEGCSYTALTEVARALNAHGVDTEIFWVGSKPLSGCTACLGCRKNNGGGCVIKDKVNEFVKVAESADGFVFGSPVHFAAASGAISCFLDRAFFSSSRDFRGKPGAAIVTLRRGGASAAFDRLNKYFTFAQMPIVSSQYWSMVHGTTPEEIKQDLEGLQIMRTLGNNMAWLLKCIDAGKKAGVEMPVLEKRISTGFVR
ncbi:MAG: flavodoxin family protein [Firmicutes bacterium]|nr:flavodoxin family protein [Bacillota bacterium]